MTTRRYTKQRRAEGESATRSRILEAVMALHEEVGPARTTISAIADRAGVERLTVYRHFPDEASMIHSCSALWSERNPPPPVPHVGGEDALAGCRRALLDLYGWYGRNARMLERIDADRKDMAILREPLAARDAYLDMVASALEQQWPRRSARRLATLRHAVEFTTWQSLQRIAKGDRQAVTIVLAWLSSVV
jgi:AcrR family transcriptional regulator